MTEVATGQADPVAQMKAGMKMLWSLGDYTQVAPRLAAEAERLAERCGLGPGVEVLDVAAGNGNFAIAAARRGARVTASDLTPKMVELGRERTAAEGLDIEWVEADAEELGLGSARYDVVASVFGAMFAPRPERVAGELFNAVRPGGLVAMVNYGTGGFLGGFSAVLSRYAGPSPVDLPSPFAWGDADEVRRRFAGLATSVETEPRTLTMEFDSPDAGWAFWERTSPPLIALRARLPPESVDALVAEGRELMLKLNRAADGLLLLDSDYLSVLARK